MSARLTDLRHLAELLPTRPARRRCAVAPRLAGRADRRGATATRPRTSGAAAWRPTQRPCRSGPSTAPRASSSPWSTCPSSGRPVGPTEDVLVFHDRTQRASAVIGVSDPRVRAASELAEHARPLARRGGGEDLRLAYVRAHPGPAARWSCGGPAASDCPALALGRLLARARSRPSTTGAPSSGTSDRRSAADLLARRAGRHGRGRTGIRRRRRPASAGRRRPTGAAARRRRFDRTFDRALAPHLLRGLTAAAHDAPDAHAAGATDLGGRARRADGHRARARRAAASRTSASSTSLPVAGDRADADPDGPLRRRPVASVTSPAAPASARWSTTCSSTPTSPRPTSSRRAAAPAPAPTATAEGQVDAGS